ncbi:MAG: tetratricopeptide repeat protein [Phycisphaerae bacterium]
MNGEQWQDAEHRLSKARTLVRQRRYEDAIVELRAAADADPLNVQLYLQIGTTLELLGRYYEAIEAYRHASDVEPENCFVWNHLGVALMHVERWARALDAFEHAQRADDAFEPAYCNRIAVYARLDRHDKAEEMFYLARLYKERCPQCFFNMAGSLMARGQWEKAAFCLKQTLELQPPHPQVHAMLAECYRKLDRLESARGHYANALQLAGAEVSLLLGLADVLIELGQFEEAEAVVRQVGEQAPHSADAHAMRGRLLLAAGRPDRAREPLARAADLDPTVTGIHLLLAKVELQAGEVMEARRRLLAELAVRPEDAAVLLELGNLLMDLSLPAEAVEAFSRLTELHPADARGWQNLGVALCTTGALPEGLEACGRARRLLPASAAVRFNLAFALACTGNLPAARREVEQALIEHPRDVNLRRLRLRLKLKQLRLAARKLLPW